MSDPRAAPPAADRNLLFGILALQMDFVGRDALIRAMNAWVLDKARSLGQVLVEQGALGDDTHAVLEALVRKHLELHGRDAEKSLAALPSPGPVLGELGRITDTDLHASLAHLAVTHPPGPEAPAADPFATRNLSVGAPTSSGGRFRVLRPHARGGLGEVFVAQDEELGREVALKEIQSRYADQVDSRARFLLEAEITGRLEHPGVVPVYGLGTYDDGRPYYAMRFIRGDSLQDAIRHFHEADQAGRDAGERTLERRQLLGRFVDVCNAVAYAHSRGVVHRDLKPANVMLGNFGETLVVDWGLAKPVGRPEGTPDSGEAALQPASAGGSTPTQAGAVLGTPAFMSPEQAAGRLDLLGPASDVYSLGATLYCLLTGRPPFDGADVGVLLQRVQRGDFPPPRRVSAAVPAALEAVCLKAMAARPEERYDSAAALAAEVEHWLADEPVAAYREPWTVRAGRWVRRHRTAVTGAVAAVAVAVVCLAAATGLLARANQRERAAREEVARQRDEVVRQKERADKNLARARQAVEDYCTNVANDERLKQADFHELRKQLLETAVPFYQEFVEQRGDDPKLQADRGRAYYQLASLRAEMGETEQAVADYRQMQAIFADLARADPAVADYRRNLGQSYNGLGVLLRDQGQLRDAEAAFRQALAIRDKLADDVPPVTGSRREAALTRVNLGNLLRMQGRDREAEAVFRQALAPLEKLAADVPAIAGYRVNLARCLFGLSHVLRAEGQDREAEVSYRRALALREKLAADFPTVLDYRRELARSWHGLASLLQQHGEPREAEAAYRRSLALREKLAADFPTIPGCRAEVADVCNDLGRLLQAQGRFREAEASYRRALALQEALARDFPGIPGYREEVAWNYNNLGYLLKTWGRRREAETACRKALAIKEKLAADFPAVPAYRRDLASGFETLALVLGAEGQHQEAEAAYRRALTLREKLTQEYPSLPAYRQELAWALNNLGFALAKGGRREEAEACYRRAVVLDETLTRECPVVPDYRAALAQNYQNLGALWDKDRLAAAEGAYRQALALREKLAADFPANTGYREQVAAEHFKLAGFLQVRGRHREAEAAYRQALAEYDRLAGEFPAVARYRRDLAACCNNLAMLLADLDRPEEAVAEFRHALALRQKLADDFPAVAGYRQELAWTHGGLGMLRDDLGRHAEAEEEYRQALALREKLAHDFPAVPGYRLWLAVSQARDGDPSAAVAEADRQAGCKGATADTLYVAAVVHAEASASAQDDAGLADRYAVRAVELLGKARAAGYFAGPGTVRRLQRDNRLESLRHRDDFRKLVADLEAGTKGKTS